MICEKCGAECPDTARFCPSCGAATPKPETKCRACGAVLTADARFCPECGAACADSESTQSEMTGATGVSEKSAETGDDNKVKAVVRKLYDKNAQTHLFGNIILAVLALVIAIVALAAPMKMSFATEYGTATVYQPIWNVIGAATSFGAANEDDPDMETLAKIEEDVEKVTERVGMRLIQWGLDHMDATEDQAVAVALKISGEELSKINVLQIQVIQYTSSDDMTYLVTGISYLATAAVIALAAIGLAIFAIVILIQSIIGIVQKKSTANVFDFLGKTFAVSTYFMIFLPAVASMFMSTLAPGGVLLALSAVSAVMYFLLALGEKFLPGNNGFAGAKNIQITIKRIVVASLAMLAFFLLAVPNNDFEMLWGGLDISSVMDSETGVMNLMLGAFAYIVYAGIAMVYGYKLLNGALKSLHNGVAARKPSLNAAGIGAIVGLLIFMIAPAVVFGLDISFIKVSMEVSVSAANIVSAIFFLAIVIFNAVFKPEKGESPKSGSDDKVEMMEAF